MTDVARGRFTITFDGQELAVEEGQTVAAALIAAGRRSWRTTRSGGTPRGVCFDCLATVNGRPNVRACLETARPGDVVTTQDGAGHADDAV